MEMKIEAALPTLKKEGSLSAVRHITALGGISYEALKFDGDGTIKSQVITRYLSAEAEAQKDQSPSLAITPENYKFKYKGSISTDGQVVYIFQVTPRKKLQGLFKGEIWIDGKSFLRVRESGQLVKNPSIFLKKVEFVRNYEIRNGIAVPVQVQSVVTTRLVGKAELNIDYTNFALETSTPEATSEASLQ